MIAKALFASNVDELQRADELGIPCEEKTHWSDYMFDSKLVTQAWINSKGHINIVIEGDEWTIKREEEVWNKLKERFEE